MSPQIQMILDQFQHLNVFEQVTFTVTMIVSLGTIIGWAWCAMRSSKDPKYPIWKDDGRLYRGSKSSPVRTPGPIKEVVIKGVDFSNGKDRTAIATMDKNGIMEMFYPGKVIENKALQFDREYSLDRTVRTEWKKCPADLLYFVKSMSDEYGPDHAEFRILNTSNGGQEFQFRGAGSKQQFACFQGNYLRKDFFGKNGKVDYLTFLQQQGGEMAMVADRIKQIEIQCLTLNPSDENIMKNLKRDMENRIMKDIAIPKYIMFPGPTDRKS